MNKNYLFPSVCSVFGWLLLFSGAIFLTLWFTVVLDDFDISIFNTYYCEVNMNGILRYSLDNNICDEFAMVAIMTGLLLLAFSEEKDENQLTDVLRLHSWYLAGISYVVVCIVIDLFFTKFFTIWYLWFFHGCIIFLLYIIIFKCKLYHFRHTKEGKCSKKS